MDKPVVLTEQDREMLARIDAAVRGESRLEPGLDGRDGVCELLAATIPQADPAFERQLEARLVGRLRPEAHERPSQRRWFAPRNWLALRNWLAPRWRRGLAVVATLLLAVAVALMAIGPHRVWAQVQQWLGYVPGIGFVDLEETRVLTAPAAVSRDGVTVTVEQVLAKDDETTVVISSRGLPPEDQVWPDGAEMEQASEPLLHLPDGRTLTPKTFTLHWGGGTVTFPALPADVYRVTLILPRLPLVPANLTAEDWAIPLALHPASGDLVADLFPQPYSPPDIVDTHHGVTLRLLEAAHGPEETALRLQLAWTDPAWENHFIRGGDPPRLTDDLGHIYWEQVAGSSSGSLSQSVVVGVQREDDGASSAAPETPALAQTLTFAPVSPSARRLTLTMGGFDFDVPADGSFTIDLGDDPQVGDAWPMDATLDVAGIPAHIIRARLIEERIGRPGEEERRTVLWFDVAPTAQDGEIGLCGLRLDGRTAGFRSGTLGNYDPHSKRFHAGLDVEDGRRVASGPITVRVDSARLCLDATWTLSWEVPDAASAGEAGIEPMALHPANSAQTRNGLTLALEEAVLTDRLTAVKVGLLDPPQDVTLHAALRWTWPDSSPEGLALTDNRGHAYAPSRTVSWGAHITLEPDLTAFAFEPLQPLARRLTLHVPAVAVVEPATAAFDVTVPEGLALTPGDSETPWLASASWEVDIPLALAGYELGFTEARLEDLNGRTLLRLVSEPYRTDQKTRWLSGLQIAAVTAPDGRKVDLTTTLSNAGPVEEGASLHQVMLAFDVLDPLTSAIDPGRYNVEIDGVRTFVQGPWELTWDVP